MGLGNHSTIILKVCDLLGIRSLALVVIAVADRFDCYE
jgi:hypothetical protein